MHLPKWIEALFPLRRLAQKIDAADSAEYLRRVLAAKHKEPQRNDRHQPR